MCRIIVVSIITRLCNPLGGLIKSPLQLHDVESKQLLPARVANVVLSDDLCVITNGLHVSRRTISMIVLIVYHLSRSIIGLSAVL